MIQEFSIKNFLSIRDKITISFLPTKQQNGESSQHLFIDVNEKTQLLKAAIIYGANASGKSNIIETFEYIHEIVTDNRKNKDDDTRFVPFYFDETTICSPGEFELIFYIKGVKFIYSLRINTTEILYEKLTYYPSRNPAKVFLREQIISFGDTLNLSKFDKEVIKGNCLPNISVIAAIGKTNIQNSVFDDVRKFFHESFLDIITPKTDLQGWSMRQFEKMSQKERRLLLHLLNQADLNISEIEIKSEEIELNERIIQSLKENGAPQAMIEDLGSRDKIETKTLEFWHKFLDVEKSLNVIYESSGTRRYFGLSGVLEKLLFSPCFVAIDELEASLHPDLLLHFLLTFLVNSKDSQLVFSTHNQTLLEGDFIRRDMLWFCEKDRDYGYTYVTRGSDFGIHKNNSIANFYKIGKLGAVPELGSVQLFDMDGDCIDE